MPAIEPGGGKGGGQWLTLPPPARLLCRGEGRGRIPASENERERFREWDLMRGRDFKVCAYQALTPCRLLQACSGEILHIKGGNVCKCSIWILKLMFEQLEIF